VLPKTKNGKPQKCMMIRYGEDGHLTARWLSEQFDGNSVSIFDPDIAKGHADFVFVMSDSIEWTSVVPE
jgi:hypothetical protein